MSKSKELKARPKDSNYWAGDNISMLCKKVTKKPY